MRLTHRRGQVVSSFSEDTSSQDKAQNSEDEDITVASLPSAIPFIHPPIAEEEVDVDQDMYDDELTESDKVGIRKRAGKLFCVAMSSTASVA